jgi:hypothetical protein
VPKPKALPKAFQSELEPFFDFIGQQRRARKTWKEIAEAISAQGKPCTAQGVWIFFKRRQKRRYALGQDPHPQAAPITPPAAAPASTAPAAAPSDARERYRRSLTEPPPPPSPLFTQENTIE